MFGRWQGNCVPIDSADLHELKRNTHRTKIVFITRKLPEAVEAGLLGGCEARLNFGKRFESTEIWSRAIVIVNIMEPRQVLEKSDVGAKGNTVP